VQGLEVSADLVDQVNAIAEQEEVKAEQMKNTIDFALYGGLVRPSLSLHVVSNSRSALGAKQVSNLGQGRVGN
jgi:hypothetical protein